MAADNGCRIDHGVRPDHRPGTDAHTPRHNAGRVDGVDELESLLQQRFADAKPHRVVADGDKRMAYSVCPDIREHRLIA